MARGPTRVQALATPLRLAMTRAGNFSRSVGWHRRHDWEHGINTARDTPRVTPSGIKRRSQRYLGPDAGASAKSLACAGSRWAGCAPIAKVPPPRSTCPRLKAVTTSAIDHPGTASRSRRSRYSPPTPILGSSATRPPSTFDDKSRKPEWGSPHAPPPGRVSG